MTPERFITTELVARRGDDSPRLALVDTHRETGAVELDLTDPEVLGAVAHVLNCMGMAFDEHRAALAAGSPF